MRQRVFFRRFSTLMVAAIALLGHCAMRAQSTSGSVNGTVTDPNGALVPGAKVEILNSVSGYSRTTTSDPAGNYHFYNLPFDEYTVLVSDPGFATARKQVSIPSTVPVTLAVALQLNDVSSTVTVES